MREVYYFLGPFHHYQAGTRSSFRRQRQRLLNNKDRNNAQHPPTLRCHLASAFQDTQIEVRHWIKVNHQK
jgi:hypothetical protein